MSAPPPLAPALVTFLETFLTGCSIGIFTGAYVISQAVSYFQNHGRRDKWPFVALVSGCLIAMLAYVMTYMSFMVHTFATNFGNVVYSLTPNKHLVASNSLATAINAMVLSFYAYRAWVVFGKSIAIAILSGTFVLFAVAAGCFLSASENMAKDFRTDRLVGISGPLNLIALSSTDVLLTTLLVVGLFRAKSKGDNASSGALINRLVLLAVETNFLPTAVQLVTLILWYTTSYSYLIITASLPQVYVFTLLTWLHARQTTRMALGGHISGNHNASNFNMISNVNRSPTSVRTNKMGRGDSAGGLSAVHIATLKEIHVDDASEKDVATLDSYPLPIQNREDRPWA